MVQESLLCCRVHEARWGEAHLFRTRPGGVLLKKDSGARTTACRSAACISCAATRPPLAKEKALSCSTQSSQLALLLLRGGPAMA